MRFLLDECLSPMLSSLFSAAGHDAVHAREIGLSSSEVLTALSDIEAQLERGAIVVVSRLKVRIRTLPVTGE